MKSLILTLSFLSGSLANAANFLDFQNDYILVHRDAVVTGQPELCDNFVKAPVVERILFTCRNENTEDCKLASDLGVDQRRWEWFRPRNSTFPDGSKMIVQNTYTATTAENMSLFEKPSGEGYQTSFRLMLLDHQVKMIYRRLEIQQKRIIRECTFTVPLKNNLGPSLIKAVRAENPAEMQALLAVGADPNYTDYDNSGTRVAEYAIKTKSLELLKILETAGAEILSIYLSRAVEANAMDIFNYLMQKPFKESDYYWNLNAPIKLGNLTALKALVSAGAKPLQGHLHNAVRYSQIEIIKYLLSLGVPAQGYSSSLDVAAENNCAACAEILIAAGAQADFVHRDLHTPLMISAATGSKDVAAILINAGAGIDRRDSEFNRALSYATLYRQPTITTMLVQAKAEMDFLSQAQMSPLMTAASGGDSQSVEVLLKAGASPCLKGRDGFTAGQMAYVSGFAEIAKRIDSVKTCK